MKLLTTLLAFSLYSIQLFAQDWEVPRHYTLEGDEDYVQYEGDVIQAAIWLRDNAPASNIEKYNEASQFVIKWVNGSPTVYVEIMPIIMDFYNKNPNMLVIYMASSAKFVLENNYSKDAKAKYLAAFKDMVDAYHKQPGMHKDKKIEKLSKAFDEGTMDAWLEKNMAVK